MLPTRQERLEQQSEDLELQEGAIEDARDRRLPVFGTLTRLESWHHDPTIGVEYPRDRHWSEVPVPAGADVKRVWEPSRFTWAFELGRHHVVDPAHGAADVFWSLLDEWCEQNQPNAGINWACGQEASFRLISVLSTAGVMSDTLDEHRWRRLRSLAAVTGERVAANIDYARSQRNNHHASEAVGLITCGLALADRPEAAAWRSEGERHLREVCDRLIFVDGGSSQYSTNYHRVFIHDLVWAAQMYRAADEAVPDWLIDAGSRSTRFLEAVTEPISGSGSFFGPDDGARVLPLSPAPHRVLVDDVVLAAASFDVETDLLGGSEALAWFDLPAPRARRTRRPDAGAAWLDSFPDMGLFVLGRSEVRIYVRAACYRYRPGHDDQLHCDVWVDGVNLVRDPGTASYHPPEGSPGPLDGWELHNGPRNPERGSMTRPSKFLWARWSTAACVRAEVTGTTIDALFELRVAGGLLTRRVRLDDDLVIEDWSEEPIETRWWLAAGSEGCVEFDPAAEAVPGYASEGYGTSIPARYHRVAGTSSQVTTIRLNSAVG